MLKHHKLISFCVGLGFLIIFQEFATPQPIFRFLIPAFLVYAGAVTAYNRWYLKQINQYNVWILIRPLLLLLSGFGIASLVPSLALRGVFLIISVGLITSVEILLGNLAENILLIETLFIAFGLFFTFAGYYYNAPSFETLYLMGVFATSALLVRSFYESVPRPERIKVISALIIGLFTAELYWALNFLQFPYTVLAVLLFNIFYFCLILNYYFFFHILNFKKIQFHLFLTSASTVLVLITTPWNIIR